MIHQSYCNLRDMTDLLFKKYQYAEDQKYAKEILSCHVFMKGIESGSSLGLLSGIVYGVFRKVRKHPFPSFRALGNFSVVGTLIGLGLTGAALTYKMKSMDDIGVKDRAWRLQRNIPQQRMDLFTAGGMSLGAFLGIARMTSGKSLMGVARCFSIGAVVGLASYFGVQNYVNKKQEEETEKKDVETKDAVKKA